jgi:putative ABC transport system permease protein
MLGMMFGVGAVIAMLSIGAGAEKQALSVIDKMGVSNVLVRAKELKQEELAEVRKKSLGVSLRDADAIREAVPGIRRVLPRVALDPYKTLSTTGKTEAKVFGVSHQHVDLVRLTIDEGRFFDATEEQAHVQVCVIGGAVRRDLFGAEPALGKVLKINDVWCEVVGVIAPETPTAQAVEGVAVSSSAREIYLPVTTLLRKLDRDPLQSPLQEILVEMADGASPRETSSVIGSLLTHLHAGANDFEIVVPEALLEQSRQTQRLFNVVMGCIAGISLVVGGIGIMNIMLASVLEQTREIGVRRAVGARRRDILVQFLATSFSLSLFGGIAGVVIGVIIARVVAAYASWPTVVTLTSVVLSTGVSTAVGIVSGLYPALRAANLDPIEALRNE